MAPCCGSVKMRRSDELHAPRVGADRRASRPGPHWARWMRFRGSGRPVDDVIDELVGPACPTTCAGSDGRTFGLVYDGGPVGPCGGRGGGRRCSCTRTRSTPRRSRRSVGSSPTPSGGRPSLLHGDDDVAGFLTSGGTEIDPVRRARRPRAGRAPSAASPNRRSCSPSRRTPRSTRRRTTSVSPCARHRCAPTGPPTSRRWRRSSARTRCSSSDRRRSTRRACRTTSRRSPRWRCRSARNCHVDACMGGFVLPFAEMLGRAGRAVGLPRRRCHDDLGRHPQARLRAEGRVGDPAPHEGVAPLPDVRVRRLARRLLRVAEHAGHPVGPADGVCLGGDVAPRHRRLRRAHPADARQRRPDARRDRARSTASGCSATVRST